MTSVPGPVTSGMTVCEGQEAVGKNRVNLIGTQSRISEVALLIKQQRD